MCRQLNVYIYENYIYIIIYNTHIHTYLPSCLAYISFITLCYVTLRYVTLYYITLHCITLHYIALHYTTLITPPQMQLQLHYNNYTTPQLQLHYTTTTTTAALHHTTSSSCGWGGRPGDHCNHCNHSKKHNSNHLSVHQWIRSAIHASQQLTSPIASYLWNFRHRLVRDYWDNLNEGLFTRTLNHKQNPCEKSRDWLVCNPQ